MSSVEGESGCVSGAFADCLAPRCAISDDYGEGGLCVDVSNNACCGPEGGRICFPAEAICAVDGGGGEVTTAATTSGWLRCGYGDRPAESHPAAWPAIHPFRPDCPCEALSGR